MKLKLPPILRALKYDAPDSTVIAAIIKKVDKAILVFEGSGREYDRLLKLVTVSVETIYPHLRHRSPIDTFKAKGEFAVGLSYNGKDLLHVSIYTKLL